MRLTRAAILTALMIMGFAQVAMSQPPNDVGPHPRPPPEAIDACKSLSSGTQCSFSNDRGTVTGTCWAPEGKPLACKPTSPAPGESAPPSKPKE